MEAAEVTALQKEIAELRQKVESFAAEHAEFRSVHVSRRGVEGPRGPQGEPGPAGPAGKSADLREAVYLANEEVHAVLDQLIPNLTNIINEAVVLELKKGGVIDRNGRAILLPGPAGRDGSDSTVPGPKGDTGAAGRNGIDGKAGPAGRDGKPGRDGQSGPQGLRGEPGVSQGPQGFPGVGLDKSAVVAIILDMKRRQAI